MKAYSLDLRQRIIDAVDRGLPHQAIATQFGVSRATVTRLVRLRRQTEALDPRPRPGRPSQLGAALDAGLLPQLLAQPDATLAAHCQRWQDTTGCAVSLATMRRAICRADWTVKKSRSLPVSATKSSASPG
jgi:transposase